MQFFPPVSQSYTKLCFRYTTLQRGQFWYQVSFTSSSRQASQLTLWALHFRALVTALPPCYGALEIVVFDWLIDCLSEGRESPHLRHHVTLTSDLCNRIVVTQWIVTILRACQVCCDTVNSYHTTCLPGLVEICQDSKVTVDLYSASLQTHLWCATASHKLALISASQPVQPGASTTLWDHRYGLVYHAMYLFTPPAFAGYSVLEISRRTGFLWQVSSHTCLFEGVGVGRQQ